MRPLLAIVLLFAAVGCANKRAPEAPEGRIREKALGDDMVRQTIDLDRNGQVDITNLFRERPDGPRLLVRKEMDLNHDGKVDIISWFDEEGNLEREQMDSDYDGHLDWTDHYKGGHRVASEYDTDFDGKPNVYKYYEVGEDKVARIDRKERDSDGDGKIDVWQRFNEEGEVVRTGRDTDGDGVMDVREE